MSLPDRHGLGATSSPGTGHRPTAKLSVYEDGRYLEATGFSWHAEDSPWKAQQVMALLRDRRLRPNSVIEVGCGSGHVLSALAGEHSFSQVDFVGYDVSPQAIELAASRRTERCQFRLGDAFQDPRSYDLLLALDVFEHVPDYLGFLESCQKKAEFKIYHVPLDIHLSSVLRGKVTSGRYTVGHLHYFTAESALATLEDSGHEVIGYRFTDSALALTHGGRQTRRRVANSLRRVVGGISDKWSARTLGGYSLLVLCK